MPDSNPVPPKIANTVAQVLALHYPVGEVAAKSRQIYEETLRHSRHIRTGNFTILGAADIGILFHEYDSLFFQGMLTRLLEQENGGSLHFDVSSRMTKAAGGTTRLRPRFYTAGSLREHTSYTIKVSSHLLFLTFRDETRPITVTGILCKDRLEALQRVMEHEIIHLLEMLVWDRSNCRAPLYATLANNIFGHTDTTHQLVTSPELAHAKFGILVGDRVEFEHEGSCRVGVVNRIGKRATILVESPTGQAFTDGKRYRKWYVPLSMLRKAAGAAGQTELREDAQP